MAKLTVADIPHMLKMWDRELNTEAPEDVSAKCATRKYWRCPECGYDWPASPKARYIGSGKCPCHESNKAIKRGVNDALTIVKGLDVFLDEDNDFEVIYTQGVDSGIFVNFKCDECGRRWNNTLKSQIRKDGNGGYIVAGCPHYNTLKRKKEDVPLCTEVDAIIRFWDYNNPMDPAVTRSNSPDKAHFICKDCGYDWTTSIAAQTRGKGKCKCCELQLVVRKGVTDVFTLVPESKRFFDFSKNKEIDIYAISVRNSKIQIDWKCPDCGSEWHSALSQRVKGKKGSYSFIGCRNCYLFSKERITSVASIPKLMKQWDFKKNTTRGLDPNLTSAYKATCADWRCKVCGYEWTAKIKSRMQSDGACPLCAGHPKAVKTRVNDVLTLCPEFSTIYDFEYNAKNGIDIYKEGANSGTKVHFKCQKCGNEWDSSIHKRVKKNDDGTYRLVDCSACSNKRFRKTPYSVEFPLLAKMYREDLNKIPLDSIRGAEGVLRTYYYWKCLDCGETFESTLSAMTMSFKSSTHGCPYCSRSKLREGESFADLHPELMDEYDPDNTIDPYSVFPNDKNPVSWICRDCGYHWEASFGRRHKETLGCPLCTRRTLIPDKNSFAAVYPELVKYWADSNERRVDEVFYNSSEWFRFICPVCGGEHGGYIDAFTADDSCPFCKRIRLSPKTNSLKALHPDIARRWSPNNSIAADMVLPTAWEKVKWICDTCGGEYSAYVKEVVNGTDECPYCNDRRILPGINSFGDRYPDLVAEMDPWANHLLPKSPYDVLPTSNYKFWFICKKDAKHKYPMSPRTRLMAEKRHKEPCLYCRGLRRKLNHFVACENNNKKP